MRTIKHFHNRKDLEKYIIGLIDGTYTLRQVSVFTGYTTVHLCNLKKKYKLYGKKVFINGHKGMPSKNRVPAEIKEKIIEIYKKDFENFNFLFFCKALKEFYNYDYSYRTIHDILVKAGISSPKHKKKYNKKIHRPRYRRDQSGDMIQVDATPYAWFSWCGDKNSYSLHGAIDDATGRVTGLCIVENECSYGYYDILEQTASNFGLPCDIYSDRSAIFCVTPRQKDKLTIQEQLAGIHEKRTQWQRILHELRIKQILAWSPQAKGRVERLWQTIQGRLPWYFKKYKIKTIEAANVFLKDKFVKIFNDEFSINREKPSVWREPPANLSNVLCSKFNRRVNSAGVISFQGYKFQVKAPRCACREIELCIYKDCIKALIDGKYYSIELIGDITDGIDERMSNVLKSIIFEYMYKEAKSISA